MNPISNAVVLSLVTLVAAGIARAADDDNVIRQPAVAVQDEAKSANDLKKERDEMKREAEAAAQRAAEAEKQAQQARQEADRARAAAQQAQTNAQAAEQAPAPSPAVRYGSGFLSISRMKVTTDKREGEWAADVTSAITLNGLANIPFTYQAIVVTADGRPHSDIQGRAYHASREVSTGDEVDTDRYTVQIPLTGLFTSRPPSELYVQAVLMDAQGRVVAVAPLQALPMPR